MKNVPAKALLLFSITLFGSPAAADDFCASGWICGKRTQTAYQLVTQDGKEICTLNHSATSDDGTVRLRATFFSNYSNTSVSMGFAVGLAQVSGNADKTIALRSVRVLSGDRKLDTRDWKPDKLNSGRAAVQEFVKADTHETLKTALDISSGDTYGVIAETNDGNRMRFEVRPRKASIESLEQLHACFTNRLRLMRQN